MKTSQLPETGHDQIQHFPIGEVHPAPENDKIYRPIDPSAPAFQPFVASIKKKGIQQPLIVSADFFLISGHRRHAAAVAAGLTTVPCIIRGDINRAKDPDAFLQLLRECNLQRDKSFDEKLREAVISTNPEQSYQELCEHRSARSQTNSKTIELGDTRTRAEISPAKAPFLAAIKAVIEDLRDFWPLSDRQIHYGLLNNPPLLHASKPGSIYLNNLKSYKSLVDLLTRARLAGDIDFNAIGDETRPVSICNVQSDVQDYIDVELYEFLLDYRRDLMVSQPNHIELLVEKNTIRSIIEPIAKEFCIPLTSGRGFCSLPPRHEMSERYLLSGKERLVVLILSDFDPDGETIASSFGRSLRDDFGVENVEAIKVALTHQQVKKLKLPPGMTAKAKSATRKAFVRQYGEQVFELEALPPEELQKLTREAIMNVIDVAAFNREIAQEKADSVELNTRRHLTLRALGK